MQVMVIPVAEAPGVVLVNAQSGSTASCLLDQFYKVCDSHFGLN